MDIRHENARPFYLPGGEHAVLLTHGFTGTPAHMRPLGERLHQAGFTVQGILLPGHGTQIADMRKSDWQQWLKAELDAVHQLKERYGKVSVAGLSMGGDLSLIAAEQMEVAACIAISAPMKTQAKFTSLARPLSLFKPELQWKRGAGKRHDLLREYNIGYTGFPTARVYDLNYLMHLARRNLYSVTCPLMVVQSHDDHTISADSAQIIYDGAASGQKEMLWLDGVPHVCTISCELEHIAERMIAFLRRAENT